MVGWYLHSLEIFTFHRLQLLIFTKCHLCSLQCYYVRPTSPFHFYRRALFQQAFSLQTDFTGLFVRAWHGAPWHHNIECVSLSGVWIIPHWSLVGHETVILSALIADFEQDQILWLQSLTKSNIQAMKYFAVIELKLKFSSQLGYFKPRFFERGVSLSRNTLIHWLINKNGVTLFHTTQ